ncbi:MAG: TraR/DksA family transcriptional regulator [Bryobacteraceae bacterium]
MPSNEIYRQRLLRERDELLAEVRRKVQGLSAAERVHEDEQAQRLHEDFVHLRLNLLDAQRLRLVNEALDRIEVGDYGICLNCERPIPAKRLEALPWARYCVSCQEELGADGQLDTDDLLQFWRSPVLP